MRIIPRSGSFQAELGLLLVAGGREVLAAAGGIKDGHGTRLSTIPGISVPLPYGGKVRTVMVDLDADALYGKGLSATDISNALNLQNLILPTGTVKVGTREYLIRLNSSPELISAMNDMPIKTVNGAPVYMRDIAQVRDGYQVQTNIVRINGGLAALLTVLRHGGASTLAVVQGVKDLDMGDDP